MLCVAKPPVGMGFRHVWKKTSFCGVWLFGLKCAFIMMTRVRGELFDSLYASAVTIDRRDED